MLHMPCQMQEMHKGKLYICYKGAPTHKAHRRPAPRGEVKRRRHHRQKSKEAQTHKLPLNTCTRDKEHTKLTLSTHDRAKSTTNQVAWPRPHSWRSQIHLPLSFLQMSLIFVHHPRKWCTSMPPPGYEAGEPPPISTKCSPSLPPATQNQEWEQANDSTLRLVLKVSN
jgi:phage/plasmid-associated DNA primase